MKILDFTFEDQSRHWKLNQIKLRRLTLLVGASGVGKTQILESIMKLKWITKGSSINGLKWGIKFSSANEDNYFWEGEFENRIIDEVINFPNPFKREDENEKKNAPKIIYEKLYRNDSLIIERDQDKIIFKQKETVKLPQEKSAINLLREEDIAIVYNSFQKIMLRDHSELRGVSISSSDMVVDFEKYKNLEDIRECHESLRTKLYLASSNAKEIFDRIKLRFIDVFPYVEDLRIKQVPVPLPFILKEVPKIQIKEKGVNEWIDEEQLSSGMHRALLHISELHLCANGTVILVDEFENSLGINCIDEITNEILIHKRELQFVITSHHPYIINNISHENWKLITRKAGVVTAKNASDFNLNKSKHEAFTQLINNDAFSEGIEI